MFFLFTYLCVLWDYSTGRGLEDLVKTPLKDLESVLRQHVDAGIQAQVHCNTIKFKVWVSHLSITTE